jgi:cytosine/creatinine deaminase
MSNEVTIGSVSLPGHAGVFSVTLRDGKIAAVRSADHAGEAAWLALPGLVNLHAHADRAYAQAGLVQRARPQSLAAAIAAAGEARAAFTAVDVQARATRLFERSISHGVTRIRTHTDVDPIVALRSMEGVLAAKQAMAGKIDVDIIAFSTSQNDPSEPDAIALLKAAVAMGANLIGGNLNASADPPHALAALLDLSEQTSLPLDIHLDEHLAHQMAVRFRGAHQRAPRLT